MWAKDFLQTACFYFIGCGLLEVERRLLKRLPELKPDLHLVRIFGATEVTP